MKVTDIYEGSSHQMRHCDECEMPEAILGVEGNLALYSVFKHAIMETRATWGDEERLEQMRVSHEDQGTLGVFDAALKCIRCPVGMGLVIDGRDTVRRVGGDLAA
jgi:hypothetical protein